MDVGQTTPKSSENILFIVNYVFCISSTFTISTNSLKRYFLIETEYASFIAYETLKVLKVSLLKIPYSEIKCPDFRTNKRPCILLILCTYKKCFKYGCDILLTRWNLLRFITLVKYYQNTRQIAFLDICF